MGKFVFGFDVKYKELFPNSTELETFNEHNWKVVVENLNAEYLLDGLKIFKYQDSGFLYIYIKNALKDRYPLFKVLWKTD